MDEDILSDVVPSNIVSRQVGSKLTSRSTALLTISIQPSQGAEGESEFEDEPMEEDELASEAEAEDVRFLSP